MNKLNQQDNIYESDLLISQYLEFHYGDTHFEIPNFAQNCILKVNELITFDHRSKCLDLGCSVGRSSFELANFFKNVDAIDFSARFISAAAHLQEMKVIQFKKVIEGDLISIKSASLKKLELLEKSSNINFIQGDACNLKAHFCDYDLIFCGNLIDRLYDPKLFLESISSRINQNGFLVLTSPYTWLEDYTPKDKWLGGFKDEQQNEVLTLRTLKNILEVSFDFVESLDIPFVIQETSRKFQHSISEMSIWQKK